MGRGADSIPVTPYTNENGSGPKRNQSHSSILWSGRREVQGFASQTLVSLRAIGPCVLRWKMLTHFLSFAPCRVRFPSPGTLMKTAWHQMEPEPFVYPMERATGIEPASSAWKAGVLPLNYARKIWSGRQDLNLRHPAPKAGALPNCATSRRC